MTLISPLSCHSRAAVFQFALRGALIVALLIGADNTAFAHGLRPPVAMPASAAAGDADQAVGRSEAAVAKAPQDAALRAALGKAYLRAGRFEAAASALADASTLGDASDRTTLSLALAQIASGQHRAALATLDRGGAHIAPAELGLVLALAGDARHGIAVLTDDVRDGPASARLRQNLAYAYALDGRWADARLTASFDLPPDEVDARLQQWAQSMQSGGERVRIAALLNVPVIADREMPAVLALNEAVAAPVVQVATQELPPMIAPPAAAPPPAIAIAEPPAPAPVARPAATFSPAIDWQSPVHHGHRAVRKLDHAVQLGAFSSARGAERAKLILAKHNPQLRGHGFLITRANVHGRFYWRLATVGFDGRTAANACTSLKRHGGACFAYAVRHGLRRDALAFTQSRRGHSWPIGAARVLSAYIEPAPARFKTEKF